MGNCWANVFRRRNVRRHIVLILIGLDNAGKTKTVNNLAGEKDDKVLPTVGFKAVNLVHKDTPVTIYDLGGGPHFRQIWSQYYSEVHGIIFVIDSSDYSRLDECKEVLEEVLSHDKISGKPVLVLANKQDKTGALDDIDVVEKLNIEPLDETVAAHRRTVINEWKREMGAPFIEMVGFEKIHQKQKFDRLLEVCVHDQNVAKAGDVASLCPNVRSLDVSRNLFSNWREVIQLSAQLPDLRELDVSKNRMAIDMPEETLTQLSINFANLEKLNVSVCDYEWSDIIALSHLWPKVTELIAAYNRIRTMTPPVVTLRTLTILRLDGNPIDSWGEVISVGHLKNLKILSLNDCQIEEIRFNDNPNNAKVDVFESLEVLFLNRNRIKDWRSVSELDKLNCLKKLYFLKNPIQNTEDYDTGSQLITAKIGTLQELNGSAITRELRRGAEYDYMKRYGAEWKLAQGDSTRKLIFDIEHCRFQELISRYGIPDDSLLVKQPKNTTLTSQLLEITLRDENGKSFKKKFPSTMAVQKLVTLAQRLFTKFGHSGIPNLYLLDDQLKGAEICLDNTMKDLAYFSVKNNDIILVRFR